MGNYTFDEIKELLLKCINEHQCEAELRLYFHGNPNEYMIIIYDDHCSFQKCGSYKEQSGEFVYKTLDELYQAKQIDGIFLDRDWDEIKDIECMDFEVYGYWD